MSTPSIWGEVHVLPPLLLTRNSVFSIGGEGCGTGVVVEHMHMGGTCLVGVTPAPMAEGIECGCNCCMCLAVVH